MEATVSTTKNTQAISKGMNPVLWNNRGITRSMETIEKKQSTVKGKIFGEKNSPNQFPAGIIHLKIEPYLFSPFTVLTEFKNYYSANFREKLISMAWAYAASILVVVCILNELSHIFSPETNAYFDFNQKWDLVSDAYAVFYAFASSHNMYVSKFSTFSCTYCI
jgi:hypothetical protein